MVPLAGASSGRSHSARYRTRLSYRIRHGKATALTAGLRGAVRRLSDTDGGPAARRRHGRARRPALLDRAARTLVANLPEPQAPWLGFRPSLPDSLPVIGRARDNARIVYAF